VAVAVCAGMPAQMLSYAYYPDGSRSSMAPPAGTFLHTTDSDGRSANVTNPFGDQSVWLRWTNEWPASQANNR
jgi:hypothetical protein